LMAKAEAVKRATARTVVARAFADSHLKRKLRVEGGAPRFDSLPFWLGGFLRILSGCLTDSSRLWDTLLLMWIDSAKVRLRGVVLAGLMLVLIAGSRAAAAQDAVAVPTVLRVEGAVVTPLSLTAADLDKMPRATATLTADGNTTTYEGVLLYDILVKAGWPFGRGMTGKGMASYVIATGKDGYQVVFAPAEIDPMFAGAKVIIADKADGAALPATQLPFRMVVPGDKMHARSIYSLVKIEVVRLRP
jgi:hypothetical protein